MTAEEDAGHKFARLCELMKQLRGPEGCPWDQKQTLESLKAYLLEESYEVLDAIDRQDWPNLEEELGDLLLQPVFLAQLATEERRFSIADSLDAINEKLVRRHPHIFADGVAKTPDDVKQRWDEIKQTENLKKGKTSTGLLDDVPRALPALVEAEKVSKKAVAVGFEWPDIEGVLDKVKEEADELAAARQENDAKAIEHEVGDLLFTIVNVARYLKVDAEQALRQSTMRFRQRFSHIEEQALAQGRRVQDLTLEEMEAFWQQAKSIQMKAVDKQQDG